MAIRIISYLDNTHRPHDEPMAIFFFAFEVYQTIFVLDDGLMESLDNASLALCHSDSLLEKRAVPIFNTDDELSHTFKVARIDLFRISDNFVFRTMQAEIAGLRKNPLDVFKGIFGLLQCAENYLAFRFIVLLLIVSNAIFQERLEFFHSSHNCNSLYRMYYHLRSISSCFAG